MTAYIPLDLGLPAFLQTLHVCNGTVSNDVAEIIAKLARCGHKFDEKETKTVLSFALQCGYVEAKGSTLSLTKLGRERILGKATHKREHPEPAPLPPAAPTSSISFAGN